MAHPILEALYIGLFASTVAQPVDTLEQPVVTVPTYTQCSVESARAPRVVYDWASGTRSVYRTPVKSEVADTPMVGITEWQVRRISGLAAG
ncbi:MAG: hypothetical protein QNJ91_03630 [Gammaproteobacteria bacterium]|nr:hypothetical protein [Gammaproteobacteria bacterium]